jgi:hypothetical protein
MSIERELLKECLHTCMCHNDYAIKKKILAELAKTEPEPVGFFNGHFWCLGDKRMLIQVTCYEGLPKSGAKLYSSPPARKQLSNAEISRYFFHPIPNLGTAIAFARAIEKAHGIIQE